jgi:hypothetical protein
MREDQACLVEERGAGRRELDLPVGAPNQFGSQALLQLLDLAAQGRLRHREFLGGPAEVQVLRNGDETPELIEGEHVLLQNV